MSSAFLCATIIFFSPLLLWLFHMHACFACLFLSILFFFAFLSLALLHPLSLPGNFWSVRTPWHSGSGIRVQLLLHDFLKNPSLSAAWYVLCLKVLCRCSWILSLVFLELSTCVCAHSCRMPHFTCGVNCQPLHFALYFLLCLLPVPGGVC